jgi:hypothetical protein
MGIFFLERVMNFNKKHFITATRRLTIAISFATAAILFWDSERHTFTVATMMNRNHKTRSTGEKHQRKHQNYYFFYGFHLFYHIKISAANMHKIFELPTDG